MANWVIKKKVEQRFLDKQLKIDDIIVLDEDIPRNSKLSFVDFAPTLKVYKDEGIKSVDYSELVEFANRWLSSTQCWDVIGCETIAAIIKLCINSQGEIESKEILKTYSLTGDITKNDLAANVSMTQSSAPVNFPVLMLRLWIKRFDYNERKPIVPQIQYTDFAPNLIRDNEFENIDCVIQRVNESIKNEEISGKILNVQTLECSAEKDWTIDSEATQSKTWIGRIVYVLRVFYALGPITKDEVGFEDFVPECLSGGNLFKKPKFESQYSLITRASNWLTDNPKCSFCSAISIDIKFKSKSVTIDTKQLAITRGTGDYIRILRIVYTKASEVETSPTLPLYLDYKVFVLHKSYSETKKSLNEFMTRNEWNAEQQYKWILLNCETVLVLSSNDSKASLEHNSDESFQAISSSKSALNRNLFFALKLYYIDQIKTQT